MKLAELLPCIVKKKLSWERKGTGVRDEWYYQLQVFLLPIGYLFLTAVNLVIDHVIMRACVYAMQAVSMTRPPVQSEGC
jgi:hypothetical protein